MPRRLPRARGAAVLLALLAGPAGAVSDGDGQRKVVGWVEDVLVFPGEVKIRAKLDTGAKTSSIHAPDLERFEVDGKPWVRFTLTNRQGDKARVERPVVREAKIKRHFGRQQTRPVISMTLCIAGRLKDVEVNLVDRKGFIYYLLVGRTALRGDFIIDPEKTYRRKLRCRPDP